MNRGRTLHFLSLLSAPGRHVARAPGLALLLAAVAVVAVVPSTARGGTPDAGALDGPAVWSRMKQALEPAKPSTRVLTLTIGDTGGESKKLVVGQAVRPGPTGQEASFVLLSPSDARGMAYLLRDASMGSADVMYSYVPMIGRTRKIFPVGANHSFFGSEFDLGDVGFARTEPAVKLLAKQDRDGRPAYQLEVVPRDNWYVSRIETWVDAATFLPIQRRIFDPAGQLWKVDTIESVTTVQGLPTITKRTMADTHEKVSTTLEASNVEFGATLPDALFDPARLGSAATAIPWAVGG